MSTWDQMTNEELCVEYQRTNNEKLYEYFLERNRTLGLEFELKYVNIFPQYRDDFDQAVRVAMWRTMKKFDASYGTAFSTIFYYYVRSECQAVIRARHSIRLPRHVWQKLHELEAEHPERLYGIMSLDYDYKEGSEDEDEATLASVIADQGPSPEDLVILSQMSVKLVDAIDKYLRPSEAVAVKMYFGLDGNKPHTLQQIGEKYNLTRERIRQLICKGLNKLRARRKLFND